VPHLTLLFFGATEDVPEAAKMVAAGTACARVECTAMANLLKRSGDHPGSERPKKSQQQSAEGEPARPWRGTRNSQQLHHKQDGKQH
jgi:hypothetical protein